ncbi:3-phosphoshikimate 1-carboxyvinyltransferase [Bifidobacterium leontopitheci]|uniref:3-phosphoshikimate 1-carboxyvinyltransferase n=1 Tax=Bifidobacterium leontopitheci TaxID=2650774 RepID=A0A6I1GPL3_9BIFI|nr:3-phosphoshikimate 1-carboxyvinyltransferase [Bifidobacterium leontopitheci]KAB7790028.1 3-phosphoshikimate 1-carboxyvinyltransferase [Bifidobacterium leontopitheci]
MTTTEQHNAAQNNVTQGNVAQNPATAPAIPDPWPAPTPHGPLDATVTIPGSKSLSNRYLILAALGTRPVTLVGLLRSRDTELMMGALTALGVRCDIDPDTDTTVTVTPPADGRFHGNVDVYCGLAGTVMRFVPGLALFADGPVRFDGDRQAYERPMKPVLDGLEQLGASVQYHGETGRLPFTITPPATNPPAAADAPHAPAQVAIDSSGSSQFISGLLLIGSRLPGGLQLAHTGEKTPSLPHIRMTVADINAAGGQTLADEAARRWTVEPKPLQLPERVVVEPDLSNAAPFLGAALIAGGTVKVPHWPVETTQPGGLLPGYLERMGAEVSFPEANGIRYCQVTSDGTVHGLGDFDLTAAGEIAPSLAAILVFADAPTRMIGIGHLRGHETNRLEALVTEIRRIGGQARELPDGIEITPVPREDLHGEVMESYADHRMATFAAMIGLAVPGVSVVNVATTRKTLPDFVGMWTGMLAGGVAAGE